MARKKKSESLYGLGNIDALTVQKSNNLYALWTSNFTLFEYKMFDLFLGRINSHDPDRRSVIFSKGELEEIMGVKQLRPEELDARLERLMRTVHVPDPTKKRGFARISLFDIATCEQDIDGYWQVELSCSEPAKKYIYGLEELKYLQYKLKTVMNIKSRYTYIMFLYFLKENYRKTWSIDLDELKVLLNCENEETYKEFKHFNNLVLKMVHKELHDVTDIRYDYTTIKKGRKVVGIQFVYTGKRPKFKDKKVIDIDDNQITVTDYLDDLDDTKECPAYLQPLKQYKPTNTQLAEIDAILNAFPVDKLPSDTAKKDFVLLKIATMQRQNEVGKKPIGNPISYIRKCLKEELDKSTQIVVHKKDKTSANEGLQTHDYIKNASKMADLEQQLLSN